MRTILWVLFAALQSASALAQPVVSAEVASDPLPAYTSFPVAPAPAVAIARDRKGVAIAWAAHASDGFNHIYVARLDAAGHLAGVVRDFAGVGVSDAQADAAQPFLAAAPSGEGFVIAWLQDPRRVQNLPVTWNVSVSQLDANLVSTNTSSLGGTTVPVIVRSGTEIWVTAAGSFWRVPPGGDPVLIIQNVPSATDVAVSGGNLRAISTTAKQTEAYTPCLCAVPNCGIGRICASPSECIPYTYSRRIDLVAPPSVFAGASLSLPIAQSSDGAAIASDGRETIIAWYNSETRDGGHVVAVRLQEPVTTAAFQQAVTAPFIVGPFGVDVLRRTVPRIATDGTRFVIVWQTHFASAMHDVLGAMIGPNGEITDFPIAASADDELDPSIVTVSPGGFLVAYEKLSGLDRRIAGRFVTFPARRRAAR